RSCAVPRRLSSTVSAIILSSPHCCVLCPSQPCPFFFSNDTASTEIYTLSLHDALPIYHSEGTFERLRYLLGGDRPSQTASLTGRSEEHTSELQSRFDLVCRLLLEKKKLRNRRSSCVADDRRR